MSRFIHVSSLFFLLFAFNNSILWAQKVYICEGFTYNIDSLEVNRFQNGFKEGVWIDKDTKGNLRSLVTYRESVKNGLYIEFYQSGKVKNKGCYADGKKDGYFSYYPRKGPKKRLDRFEMDILIKSHKMEYPVFPPGLLLKEKCPCFD